MTAHRHRLSKIVRLRRRMIRAQLAAIRAWKAYSTYFAKHPEEQGKVHGEL